MQIKAHAVAPHALGSCARCTVLMRVTMRPASPSHQSVSQRRGRTRSSSAAHPPLLRPRQHQHQHWLLPPAPPQWLVQGVVVSARVM
jgi:hypothetical protein